MTTPGDPNRPHDPRERRPDRDDVDQTGSDQAGADETGTEQTDTERTGAERAVPSEAPEPPQAPQEDAWGTPAGPPWPEVDQPPGEPSWAGSDEPPPRASRWEPEPGRESPEGAERPAWESEGAERPARGAEPGSGEGWMGRSDPGATQGDEPGIPPYPDQPVAPEVPEPQQVRGKPPAGDDEPGVGDTQAFPMPGATPPYPGWESAAEPGDQEPAGSTRPSRYDPPTAQPGEPYRGTPMPVERRGRPGEEGGGPAGGRPHAPPEGAPGEWPGYSGGGEAFAGQGPPEGGYGDRGGHPPPDADQGGRMSQEPGGYQGGYPPQELGQGGYPPQEPGAGQGGYPPQEPGAGQGGYPSQEPGGYAGPGPYGGGGQPPYPPQGYGGQPGGYGAPKQGGGLGTASLVLGIVSLFLLFLCGLGILTAIVGIILGIIAVVKNANKGRAWAGIILSALALILATIAIAWFYTNFSDCMNLPTQELAQRCVEDKLGVGTGQ
ncbi:hypothetical protein [Streptosporangium sp. KLBMP 9127]|nr:hypothetical protein [Streptosporangium sp. KLBMP 9127]